LTRSDRQERVEGWQQNTLEKGKIAIIGAGALGNYVSLICAAYGVGQMDIYDFDTVEEHNLARQIAFTEEDAVRHRKKCDALSERLKALNSKIIINGYDDEITKDNVDMLLGMGNYDIIVDATDNLWARYYLNKFSIENDIPLVHMGSSPTGGEVCVITRKTACLNCMNYFREIDLSAPKSCRDIPEASIAETNAIIGGIGAGQIRMLLMKIHGQPLKIDRILEPTYYYSVKKAWLIQIEHEKNKDCDICSKYK